VLSAGRGRPPGTPFRLLVRTLSLVSWTECGACCLWFVAPRIWWRVSGTRDVSVEVLFPQGRERFELTYSGWSRVLGIDAVGGPPHCDFADEGGAQVASRYSPDRRAVTSAGVIFDLGGEVGDQLGSLGQVGPPDRMGMERFWYAGEPGQRTWLGGCGLWEAPVEDGGHVACGREIATARGFL
jgi:hypothetical protein